MAQDGAYRSADVQLACLALLFFAAILIMTKGHWLDEYWSVWLSDSSLPFNAAVRTRWLPDVGHPPLFNLLFWSFGHLVDLSVKARRTMNGLLAASFMLPTLLLMRTRLAAHRYRLVFVLTLFASPLVFAKIGEHRAYFMSIAAVAAFLLTVREVVLRKLQNERIDSLLLGWLFAVAFVALNTEYFATVVGAAIAAAAAIDLWLAKHKREAVLIAGAVAFACTAAVVQFALARKLGAGTPPYQVSLLRGAAAIVAGTLSGGVVALPIIIHRLPTSDTLNSLERDRIRFLKVEVAAIILSITGFLLVLLATHAVLVRHALLAAPLAAGIVAEYATIQPIRRVPLFLAAVISSAGATTAVESVNHGWEQFAPILRGTLAACPQARLIAVQPAALAPQISSFHGSIESIQATYLGVADEWSLPVRVADRATRFDATSTRCPTVLWVDHNWTDAGASVRDLARAAGVTARADQLLRADALHGDDQSMVVILPPGRAAHLNQLSM